MLKIAKYRNVLSEDGKSIKQEKIKLKELEKFGFEKVEKKELTHKASMHIDSKKEYYFEIV